MKIKDSNKDDAANKRLASDYLKNADKLLKINDLESALHEVEKALEIDPGNFYARAYSDRITTSLQHTINQDDTASSEQHQRGDLKKKLQVNNERLEEERKRQESDRQRAEAELRRRALEIETRRQQEDHDRVSSDGERKRRDDENQRKLSEERQRLEIESHKRIEEEKGRLQEEIRKKEILNRKKTEEEERRRAEEEANRLRREADEQKRRDEEHDRRRREMEERKKAEEETKRRLEEELRKRLEEERIRKQEEQLIRASQNHGKSEAAQYKVLECFEHAKNLHTEHRYDEALTEIQKVLLLEPQHMGAHHLKQMINNENTAKRKQQLEELCIVPRQLYSDAYKRALKLAWSDGLPTPEIQSLLESVGSSLQITYDEHRVSESAAKTEVYNDAMRISWTDGALSPDEVKMLERLRNELGITADEHLATEQMVRKELGL